MTNTTESKSCCSGNKPVPESPAHPKVAATEVQPEIRQDSQIEGQPLDNRNASESMKTVTVMQKDPVCGMIVNPLTARAQVTYEDAAYYFCCQGCATKFSTNPEFFLKPMTGEIVVAVTTPPTAALSCCSSKPVEIESRAQRASIETGSTARHESATDFSTTTNVATATEFNSNASDYTCPMHPEVVSNKPGDCPACGMPLEAMMPGAGDDGKAEIDDISHRLALSASLTVPVALLSMSHMLGMGEPGATTFGIPHLVSCWLQLALSTPVVMWAARPFFDRGVSSVKNRSLNMFTLLSLGIGLPYLYSLVSLLWVTATAPGSSGVHEVYFESAAVIATLAWVGQLLEAKARVRSSSAIRELVSLLPVEASVILHDGSEMTVPVSAIAVGAKIRVRPGERIAVDGVTIDGVTSVNESMLTGEAIPVEKHAGSLVSAGTINGSGSLVVEARRVGTATTLSQIVSLVSQAQRSRVPAQQLADKVASVFVPAVMLTAVATVIGWSIAGEGLTYGLSAALAVLVVACPCALGLATPMSIIVATGRAARAGVLFKEARSLQLLAGVDTLVIDKTGTLTVGAPSLIESHFNGDLEKTEILVLAAAVESRSEHPLAAAIVAAGSKPGKLPVCTDFASTPGGGVSGTVAGRKIVVGTPTYLAGVGVNVTTEQTAVAGSSAVTSVFVAVDGNYQARFDFSDEIRASAKASIAELTARGIRVVMATGDSEAVAQSVATALGITEVHARLLPLDKVALVRKLQHGGARVAMAGDGINDAPSLVLADVGIAMASGTDIAVHSADIVLVNSDVQGIVRARKVSRAMLRNITQNLCLAFAYNLIAIPVATGALIGITGVALDPMVAAAAMSLSSVAVIVNALRLRGLKL